VSYLGGHVTSEILLFMVNLNTQHSRRRQNPAHFQIRTPAALQIADGQLANTATSKYCN